jgi:hypothetical protein
LTAGGGAVGDFYRKYRPSYALTCSSGKKVETRALTPLDIVVALQSDHNGWEELPGEATGKQGKNPKKPEESGKRFLTHPTRTLI